MIEAFNIFAGQMRTIQDFQPQTSVEVEALKARAVAAGEETARVVWMQNRADAVAALLTDRMHAAGMLPADRRLAVEEIAERSAEQIGAVMYDAALAGRDLLEFANERFDSIVNGPAPKPERPPFGLDAQWFTPAGKAAIREQMAVEQAYARLQAIDPNFDEWLMSEKADNSGAALLRAANERFDRIAAGE